MANQTGSANTDIPQSTIAKSASVEFGGKIRGSGFYVSKPPDVFFVTAKHVLLNPDKGDELRTDIVTLIAPAFDLEDNASNKLGVNLRALLGRGVLYAHPTRDVLVFPVGEYVSVSDELTTGSVGPSKMSFVEGILPVERTKSGYAAFGELRMLKDVVLGNRAYMVGYPTSLSLTDQLDFNRPLITAGVIAGVNSKNRTIIIDRPVYPGFSGSPLIEVEQIDLLHATFPVVGVAIQWIPDTGKDGTVQVERPNIPLSADQTTTKTVTVVVSGFGVVEPMDSVLELIAKHQGKR